MPISIDRFDEYDGDSRRETNAERVVRFLARNHDRAFKATEIAAETGINPNSIHPVLSRLRDRRLVRHKEPYWAVGDPERIREATALQSTIEFLDRELGDEDRQEWLAAAESADEDDQ